MKQAGRIALSEMLEKVKAGLSSCTDAGDEDDAVDACRKCPYREYGTSCLRRMLTDTKTIIKATKA